MEWCVGEFALLGTMQGKVTGNTVLIYTGLYNYFMASQQWGDCESRSNHTAQNELSLQHKTRQNAGFPLNGALAKRG